MRISGHYFLEHVRLLTPLFGAIAAVWALRFLVGAVQGAPSWLIGILSVSIIVPICIVLATLLLHVKWSGGYTSVVLASFLLVAWGQVLVVLAILFSVVTGIENIYTAPEFSLTDDAHHSRHIFGHLTFVVGIQTLVGSLMGCIILYMLRRANPSARNDR
jgi:hypothetical protein